MIDASTAMGKKEGGGNPSAMDKRIRRQIAGRIREYFAITAPGFENSCRKELIGLGMGRGMLRVDDGGVTFAGRFVDCQRANLHLRSATRVLMRIDAFKATNLRRLGAKAGGIAWELFLPSGRIPDVKVSSHRSRLYHTEAIARRIQNSISHRLALTYDSSSPMFSQTVFVRVVEDRFMISLDSSGDPLYKRGMKAGPARAPIRETLAAAILMAAGYDPQRPLVDPMCGSGTFSIEAAMMAKRMAPGVKREFALMGWPAFREGQWTFLKRDADAKKVVLDHPSIFASDIDANASEQLAGMVDGNGMSDAVRVMQRDVFQSRADQYGGGPGLIVINPPYGIRIGSTRQADDLFNGICQHLTVAFNGWDVALIAPHRDLARRLPFPARRLPLLHGGLKLTLVLGNIP